MAKRKDLNPMPKAKPKAKAQTYTVIEPPGGTTYFYANLFHITWTVVDLKIRFAELTKIEMNGHNTITERAVATMAWTEAKTLLKSLEAAVADYERVNGELKVAGQLKLPPGALPTPAASRREITK